MLAAYGGHEDVVAALIVAGADVTSIENRKGQRAEDLVGLSRATKDSLQRWQSFIERKELEELERAIEKAAAAGSREDDHVAFLGSGLDHPLVRRVHATRGSIYAIYINFQRHCLKYLSQICRIERSVVVVVVVA